MDCKKRTLIKSLSWKIAGSLSLVLLTYLTTESLKVAGIIAILQFIITFFLYFVHERVWNYITWGKTTGLSIQFTGMSRSGKSTLSKIVSQNLRKKGKFVRIKHSPRYCISRILVFYCPSLHSKEKVNIVVTT